MPLLSGFIVVVASLLPDQTKATSAEHKNFNHIHFSDTSGTCLIESEINLAHRHRS